MREDIPGALSTGIVDDLSRVIKLPDTEVYNELKQRESKYYSAIEKVLDRERDLSEPQDPISTLARLGPGVLRMGLDASTKIAKRVASGQYDLSELTPQEESSAGIVMLGLGVLVLAIAV